MGALGFILLLSVGIAAAGEEQLNLAMDAPGSLMVTQSSYTMASARRATDCGAGAEEQYEYQEHVQFKQAHHGKHTMPRMQLLQQPAQPQAEVQELTKTVLIKRDGAKFTKRCLPQRPGCAAAKSVSRDCLSPAI